MIERCKICYNLRSRWVDAICTDCFSLALKLVRAEQSGVGGDNVTVDMLSDKLNEGGVIPDHVKVANIIKYGPMPNQGDS